MSLLSSQYQAVFIPEDNNAPDIYPEKKEVEEHYIFTNAQEKLSDIFTNTNSIWHVINITTLEELVFPTSRPLKCQSARDIWSLWLQIRSRLDSFPVWAIETAALILQGLDEPGLHALLMREGALRVNGQRKWSLYYPPVIPPKERPPLPQLEDCTPLDQIAVAKYLLPKGTLAEKVNDYEIRPGQILMLKSVVEAFNTGRHLVVEAGTGVGKSLAYLLPAALWAKLNQVPVVISTNTKNLQTQLIEKDLPAVLSMISESENTTTNEPFISAIIKGRQNYLCLRRFGHLVTGDFVNLHKSALRDFLKTLIWAVTTTSGDLDSLSGQISDPSFLAELTCSSEECSGRACKLFYSCFVQKARFRALGANLIIANHALAFSELATEKPISLPRHSQIIFDEAHNLEEAATDYFTKELSYATINRVERRLYRKRGKRTQGLIPLLQEKMFDFEQTLIPEITTDIDKTIGILMPLLDDFRLHARTLLHTLNAIIPEKENIRRYKFELPPDAPPNTMPPPPNKEWEAIRTAQNDFVQTITNFINHLASISDAIARSNEEQGQHHCIDETTEIAGTISLLTELRDTTNLVLSGTEENYVFWAERQTGPETYGSALAAPINVGPFLANSLYKIRQSVILCSATLTVGGSFTYIKNRIGLNLLDKDRAIYQTAQSPFDYIQRCHLAEPLFLPEPTSEDQCYETELSKLIINLAKIHNGRTLVLFTSYKMLTICATLCRDKLAEDNLELLVHGENGSRTHLTTLFRTTPRTVLFGTQSFWEGVDIVGEALSCVIVARLPFATPGDPIIAARSEEIEKHGGSAFRDLSLPAAVIKLKQGFGRLIRHRKDSGSVIIADTRLTTKSYGSIFIKSLPSPLHRYDNDTNLLKAITDFRSTIK